MKEQGMHRKDMTTSTCFGDWGGTKILPIGIGVLLMSWKKCLFKYVYA